MAVYLGTNMVNVHGGQAGGLAPTLQTKTKTYTPTTLQQTETVTADTGYDGLDEVDITVNAVPAASYYSAIYVMGPSTVEIDGNGLITARLYTTNYSLSPYNGSGWVSAGDTFEVVVDISGSLQLTKRTSTDLTTSGATVTVPAGYYPEAASKSVSSMTLPTSAASSATSGYTSKATIGRSTAAQYINIPPGYNSAGAYYVISAVANGSATAPASISGTSATISTGTNTLTLTKTVSVTPTVSAGYVSSGTAGNSSVSLTASVTTKAAATITPTTTNQTIAADTYLTGAQTILGDANLIASNIKKNVPIFGVTGSYEGDGGGGDSGGMTVATTTKTLSTAAASISFTGLEGEPTSFVVTSEADLATGASPYKTAAVVFDGTDLHGQTITNTSNAQVSYDGTNFSISYSNGTLTITGSTYFQANTYKLVYTYGGTSSNIDTADVQVGSGATSITFTGLTDSPDYFSCIFKSNFSTSSGYQRVIAVVYDGDTTYGLEMDSGAHYSNAHWSYTYNNGSLTITSQGTNSGGYFHQPGYYQLTYGVGGTVAPAEIEVEPLSITQNGTYTAPSGKAYSPITVAVSGGGGANIDTKSMTNSSNQNTSISFSSMKGEPKAFFARCTSSLSRSSSNTYYYVADMVYDGTSTVGNMHARSTGQYSNITSGYSWSYSGTTLTLTSSGARGTSPGSFYNGTYELVYIY